MPNNTTVNEVKNSIGETYISLRNDDVTEYDVAEGKKFHLPSGAEGVGKLVTGIFIEENDPDEMDAHLLTNIEGVVYKYTGVTTPVYRNGDLYVTHYNGEMTYHHYTFEVPYYEGKQTLSFKLGTKKIGTKEVQI